MNIDDIEVLDDNTTKEKLIFTADQDVNIRLDVYLTKYIEDYSRSFIQKIIKENLVTVNGLVKNLSYKVKKNDLIQIVMQDIKPSKIEPQDIPLDIVYEDDDIIIINKKRGMVVHPATGNCNNTLVNALLFHTKNSLSDINGIERPGIVHRIDKDTSGVIVACKNNSSHKILTDVFSKHNIKREYVAIVKGYPDSDKGLINAPIGRDKFNRLKMAVDSKNGKRAVTNFEVLEKMKGASYIKAVLETGRTHQIRTHMAFIGNPLLGDDIYGGKDKRFEKGQLLHARLLGFIHPIKNEYMEFTANLDDYFQNALEVLRKHE
ncbi:MAG TPA: RluA family pseudouridine synthase [Clostridia bacterium]|jgi:23S rRNA pseudouridine1911/1915/1917 synthase|nr:MAG: Ribosomal large subunit pseudouridine synthase D [Firmicutes bacterium ADurb.Bin146]HOD93177.1 RluA family pseudouridine synthase [Clostridia bacterium]HQM38906.1 RluA family pseudouridine synthase [Clostridia bacterium]